MGAGSYLGQGFRSHSNRCGCCQAWLRCGVGPSSACFVCVRRLQWASCKVAHLALWDHNELHLSLCCT